MKKKVYTIMMIISMLLGTVACSNTTTENTQKETITTEASEEDTTTEASEEDTTTEASKEDATTEASKEDATTEASKEDATTEASKEDATTEVSKEDETTNSATDFFKMATESILQSKYVNDKKTRYGYTDAKVKIIDKFVNGNSGKVNCEITYTGTYLKGSEQLICEFEKWTTGWKIGTIKTESSSIAPLKFPEKVSFEKVTTADGSQWVISANLVVTSQNESNLILIDDEYTIKEVKWNTSQISKDYTTGSVSMQIICKDNVGNSTVTGTLKFNSSTGKWTLTIDSKTGDAVNPVDYGSGVIKIWVSDALVPVTREYAKKFIASNSKYSGYSVIVESATPEVASVNMLTDVEYGADIYMFLQDYIASLVYADALTSISGTTYEQYVKNSNIASSVQASKYGSSMYAFPATSDNGYFLYYDKSVVKNPSSLEAIISDCEKAGKKFCFNLSNGWYNPSFFFATGCILEYEVDAYARFNKCNMDFNSQKGLVALREMIDVTSSTAFCDSSDIGADFGAIVTGTWFSGEIRSRLGDNYAATKLPSFTGCDGKQYQLGSFSGHKLWGVKPQAEKGKATVCLELAKYLSSEEVQLLYFEQIGWVPSDLTAMESSVVKADIAVNALIEQNKYAKPQYSMPGDYWQRAASFGVSIIDGVYTTETSDMALMDVLAKYENYCKALAK